MLKRFIFFAAALAAALPSFLAHAADVNTADEAALRIVKGIGPAKAKAIVEERAAGGSFKDSDDLRQRVKGLGGHAVDRLQAEGLTIGATAAIPCRHDMCSAGADTFGLAFAERPYRATAASVLYNRMHPIARDGRALRVHAYALQNY
jgi:competence protein ComEA